MAKKLPPLVLLTLTLTISTLAAAMPTPTFAETMLPSGKRAWTVEELSAFNIEAEQERQTACGADLECQRDLYMDQIERGGIYRALDTFNSMSFMLTSVNPEQNTIRVLFHDEDYMMKFWTDTPVHYPLTEAYIVWNEQESLAGMFDISDLIKSGTPVEGMHILYSADITTHEPGWFPVDEEVEIFAPDANLSLNTRGIITYSMANDPLNSMGGYSYASCLNSPDYQPGMECRVLYDETFNFTYLPFAAKEKTIADTANDEAPTDIIKDATNISESDIDANSTITEDTFPLTIGKGSTSDDDSTKLASATVSPKSPDTGAETYPGTTYDREINMPWWIIALIMAGITLLIWWFIPNHPKSQKTTKISKKSLDKNKDLR